MPQPRGHRMVGKEAALLERATRLTRDQQFAEAIPLLEEYLAKDDSSFAVHQLLGLSLYKVGRLHDALGQFQLLSDRFPDRSESFGNLATVLLALGHEALAFQAIDRALTLDPNNVLAMRNLAEILQNLGNWAGARDTYVAALALAPNDPKLRMQYGMCLVALGEWPSGWSALEIRDRVEGVDVYPEKVGSPRWDGASSLEGQRLLITHEQGLGDSIMCVRFARTLADRGAIVHVRTHEPLVPLLRQVAGVTSCTAVGTVMPEHDVHVPLMSLPHVLQLQPADLDGAPYLEAPGPCPPHIEALLPHDDRLTVSLSWAGNPNHSNDRRRSINGALLEPLLALDGIRFVALQKFPPISAVLPEALHAKVIDVGPHCRDFAESAHVLRRVDVAITVDSATAHLAGALGTRTFTCLPFRPDYRWGTIEESTPWYGSMSLMRQPEPHAWSAVLETIAQRLRQLARR